MEYTAKKTRHKYADRYIVKTTTGLKGEVEKYGDNDWRVRFGSLVGGTKHPTMDAAATVVFNAHKEARERIVVC